MDMLSVWICYLAKVANISHWYLCGKTRELVHKLSCHIYYMWQKSRVSPHIIYVAKVANQLLLINFFFNNTQYKIQIVLGQTRGGGSIPSAAILSPCARLTMLSTLFTIILKERKQNVRTQKHGLVIQRRTTNASTTKENTIFY